MNFPWLPPCERVVRRGLAAVDEAPPWAGGGLRGAPQDSAVSGGTGLLERVVGIVAR